ncbi:hypothetical protein DAQ1742_03599 [Dickeya aquatica]|uniref:Uncharacterized protein n=1 Tax=Dickeya aquatica TaxID=1401087 RepID=A0A375AER3_9GAMM|nr:hypothetical protein DAQ1742_03599 [Dickeya aquatica]
MSYQGDGYMTGDCALIAGRATMPGLFFCYDLFACDRTSRSWSIVSQWQWALQNLAIF